jgi:hypothetical protein
MEGKIEGRKDVEDDVRSYGMMLRKRKNTETRKRRHYITLSGELALEEFVDLSPDRP